MNKAKKLSQSVLVFTWKWAIPTLQLALMLLAPALVEAAVRSSGGQAQGLNGSLGQTNSDLLDFLENDVATLCMIIGGILAAATHIFNNGQGTKFFLSVFGCGVMAMAFTTILSLARGLAMSVGH